MKSNRNYRTVVGCLPYRYSSQGRFLSNRPPGARSVEISWNHGASHTGCNSI